MRNTLDGITEFLDYLENEKSSKIIDEEDFRIRDKKHENLLKEIVELISELNENQLKEETKENSRIAKLEAERNEDCAMLISVVKQIEQVNQIKSITGTNGLPGKTAGPEISKPKIENSGENIKLFPTNSSEMKIRVTNFEKSKKSIKKKSLFPKIKEKNREEKGIFGV
ncbi:uncharacterized protein LOC117178863 [Belonocnema kinseyi]|uniref:uncharacterized protein LOC117178863 n=1 Tax=Belonocnema kinseyi TaxID=2817044 RepID=UPI00143D089A|nr:uncharacterized protein LOC117178863 [Belonocnema kinseyi]